MESANTTQKQLGSNAANIHQQMARVIAQEAEGLQRLAAQIPFEALDLVQRVLHTQGRIVFSGLGKAGLIGRKLAATYASLGIPSLFVHPTELLHGDLGMLMPGDLFCALSKSGSGSELSCALPHIKQRCTQTVLICMHAGPLSKLVDLVVKLPFEREACPHNLAPTTSATLMLAFGHAVAIAVSSQKGFGPQDFAAHHPQGVLGLRLKATVQQFMHTDLPCVPPDASFEHVLYTISSKRLGVACLTSPTQRLLGVITDGDLRRSCQRFGKEVFEKMAQELASTSPKTIPPECLASHALILMEQYAITSLTVVDNDHTLLGVIHLHDLVQAGIKE